MQRVATIIVPPILCLSILIGIVAEARTRSSPETTELFHQQASTAVAAIPETIDNWTSQPEVVPKAALNLLRNPAICSRRYTDSSAATLGFRDRSAQVLVVHCRDSRDIYGHYPKNCYPNNGWELVEQTDHESIINGLKIPWREYKFFKASLADSKRQCVYNFLIVPGKGIFREMDGVAAAAEDYQQRYYGAAQVQIVMSADLPEDERDMIFRTLVGALTDCIRTLKSGGLKP